MHTSKSKEPDAERCGCGRLLVEAVNIRYQSLQGRLVFHRCQCGREWTERVSQFGMADPVTSDELIEVHQQLARLEGPLSEILKPA